MQIATKIDKTIRLKNVTGWATIETILVEEYKGMSKLAELLQNYRSRWRDHEKPTHRLSQEDVSLYLGYSESTYGQWERGRGRPSAREDLVKLIHLFHSGRGVENLAEANALLQAGGFGGLQPDEISQIEHAWLLPNSSGAGPRLHEFAAIHHVHQRFPTERFEQYLHIGQEIRILNTWIPNLDPCLDLLIVALQRQASVRILLLYPRSLVAELRNEAIAASPRPVLHESVQQGVEENFKILEHIYRHLNEEQRGQLQVRLYNSLPSISIYQVNQFCLMGIYFHGALAISSPQFEVNMTSFLGKRIDEEFNTLWSIAQPIHHLDQWRRELDLLSGRF